MTSFLMKSLPHWGKDATEAQTVHTDEKPICSRVRYWEI